MIPWAFIVKVIATKMLKLLKNVVHFINDE